MHTIHHTSAVILRSEPRGEYDKVYWLFTEYFGLVRAVATGVRKSAAKLKSQLVDYAFVEVDLVKGREVWRLVSARLIYQPLTDTTKPLARGYVRALATLARFIIDEGEHRALYAHIEEVAHSIDIEVDPRAYDALAIWRILVHLGYIDGHVERGFVQEVQALRESDIKALVQTVNDTITQTHL